MKKRITALLAVLFWLAVWQIAAMAVDQKILLVTPIAVAKKITELVPKAEFWRSVLFSSGRILSGFALGVTVGTGAAAAAGRSGVVRKLLAPLMSTLKSVPVASFTILALMWISSKNLSVPVTFLISFPVMYSNMLTAIDSLDPKLKEMAKVFEIPPFRRFVGVYLSQILPYFRSAAGLAMGLCWKSGAAAEVIGIPDGSIGEKLYEAKVYLETAELFAWTAVIICLSFGFEKAFMALVDTLVKRVEKMGF